MSEETAKKKGVNRGYIVVAIIGALIIACGQSGDGSDSKPSAPKPVPKTESCLAQSRAFIEDMLNLLEEWQDAEELASSTARIALSPVVGQLQQLRRDAADLPAPACAMPIKNLLLEYMDGIIDAYLKFMAQQSDGIVERQFNIAVDTLEEFQIEWNKLLQGKPPYD